MSKSFILFLIFTVLTAVFLSINHQNIIVVLNYFGFSSTKSRTLFTSQELLEYNGIDNPDVYLAILGSVYNVTKGIKHYGPGSTYNVFVGRDASRAFVTGEFSESGASDDVTGFNEQELLSLNHWVEFYKREYPKIGKLIGKYYDKNGKLTPYYKELKKLIKLAKDKKQNQKIEEYKLPPCNVEWSVEYGSRVWCTNRSGGIERNWIGVPRKLHEPGSDSYRCACVNEENIKLGNIKEYDDCNPSDSSCYIKS